MSEGLDFRKHGVEGPLVVVLHGGPGAPGSAGELSRALGRHCRVLEPFQRRADDRALTVARHVVDLRAFITLHCGPELPVLVGHSWGAMLALAFAAECPRAVRALALVGGGTWDLEARAAMARTVDERMTPSVRARLEALSAAEGDDALTRSGEIIAGVYGVDLLPREGPGLVAGDARGHRETWQDMIRLQEEGVYPAAFTAISCPVQMLHGLQDPHPAETIRDSLRPWLPQLTWRFFDRCGHEPWRERWAREAFLHELTTWL